MGCFIKKLAEEFLELVADANAKKHMVSLKYFSDVAEEINNFFLQAEYIVSEPGRLVFKHAMEKIISGCQQASDVVAKRSDFFYRLQYHYSICKDERESYYTENDYIHNLEGLDLEKYPSLELENEEGYKYCSHIHKLRRGIHTTDELSSDAILVTGTQRVLDISHEIVEFQRNENPGEKYCRYAVSMSYITNLLWTKLNRGYGSIDFPKNLDAIIKARTILSGYITQGIYSTYKELQAKEAEGDFEENKIMACLLTLKEKPSLPEELNADNVEQSLDFTEEHLTAVAEEISVQEYRLKEKDNIIAELSSQIKTLERNLTESKYESNKKQEEKEILEKKVHEIEEGEKEKSRRKEIRKIRQKIALSVIWKLVAGIAFPFVIKTICDYLQIDFGTWLGVALGVISPVSVLILIIKNDYKDYKKSVGELYVK